MTNSQTEIVTPRAPVGAKNIVLCKVLHLILYIILISHSILFYFLESQGFNLSYHL